MGTQYGGREAGQSQNGMPVFARIIHYNNEQILVPRQSQTRLYLHPIDEDGDRVEGMSRTRSAWDWINAIANVVGMDADQVLSWVDFMTDAQLRIARTWNKVLDCVPAELAITPLQKIRSVQDDTHHHTSNPPHWRGVARFIRRELGSQL